MRFAGVSNLSVLSKVKNGFADPVCAVKVFYRSNPAREAFVEMCESDYVQKMTFDSYLYKTVVPGNPLDDVRLLVQTVGSLLRGNALRQGAKSVSFGSRTAVEEGVAV